MILSALPATQGLYGFVAFLMLKGLVETNPILLFGIGVGTGLVFLLSAIRQGQTAANGIAGIAAGHDVMTNTMIYCALPELFRITPVISQKASCISVVTRISVRLLWIRSVPCRVSNNWLQARKRAKTIRR